MDADIKSLNETENNLKNFTNVKNTKEFKEIKNLIDEKKSLQIKKQNDEKLSKYKNIFNVLLKKGPIDEIDNNFKDSVNKSFENKKSDLNELIYACVKLEILANLGSLKKYDDLRNKIQLQLLQNKFNKNNKSELDNLNSIISQFIINFSSLDSGADHKKLWNRMTKCFEVLI